MDEKNELARRFKSIRMVLRGIKSCIILQAVQRSRAWLSKWRTRYEQFGLAGLKSRSRRPQASPQQHSAWLVREIVRIRRRLVRQKVGLIGAHAVQQELRSLKLIKRAPSPATINRILHQQGLIAHDTPRKVYFPAPAVEVEAPLHALDWTCRYLQKGPKVYAFHTLDLETRDFSQTLSTDKTGDTVWGHLRHSWKRLGFPAFLQVDNDSAFSGGGKAKRAFSQFVRRCLYVGVEPIFLPVAEPERNGDVESLNRLWNRAFWNRRRFKSFRQVVQTAPDFYHWYLTRYRPPKLRGQTPAQARAARPRPQMTAAHVRALPSPLPLTAGRVHFIRKVSADGAITILNEPWRVGKRRAGQYVWATITTHTRRLTIYHRRSAQAAWRIVKEVPYAIDEPVARLKSEFKRK
jgi:hypothetical protein